MGRPETTESKVKGRKWALGSVDDADGGATSRGGRREERRWLTTQVTSQMLLEDGEDFD